jgi:osmoprotectant transport system permease protein
LSFRGVWLWLNDPSNYHGTDGIVGRLTEHLRYTALALVIAAVIALPLGLYIGHTGRGIVAVAGVANALRAIPTFGLLVLLVVLISPKIHSSGELPYLLPTEIVLVLLAIPPILTNTYAGVQNVDPAVRDAARGMGMTAGQVALRVEFPNALPLILSGLRSATLQLIATATVAAYVTLGGFGRFLVDGLSDLNDPHDGYTKMAAGGVLVAALAIVADLVFALAQRVLVSRGVSGRFRGRGSSSAGSGAPATSATPAEVRLANV